MYCGNKFHFKECFFHHFSEFAKQPNVTDKNLTQHVENTGTVNLFMLMSVFDC